LRKGEARNFGNTVNAMGHIINPGDSPLTRKGIAQAEQMGARLAHEIARSSVTFTGYVSPPGRAKATAALVTKVTSQEFI